MHSFIINLIFYFFHFFVGFTDCVVFEASEILSYSISEVLIVLGLLLFGLISNFEGLI